MVVGLYRPAEYTARQDISSLVEGVVVIVGVDFVGRNDGGVNLVRMYEYAVPKSLDDRADDIDDEIILLSAVIFLVVVFLSSSSSCCCCCCC